MTTPKPSERIRERAKESAIAASEWGDEVSAIYSAESALHESLADLAELLEKMMEERDG